MQALALTLAVTLFILASATLLLHNEILRALGAFLSVANPLEKADAILLLAGNPILTAPEAAFLLKEGWAPTILLVSEVKPPGYDELCADGIRAPRDHEIATSILHEYGVPEEKIFLLDEGTAGTYPELKILSRHLSSSGARSAILVCLKTHSRRVRLILHRLLDPGIRSIIHPASRDPYQPGGWWRNRLDFRHVVLEYTKLLNLWLWGDFWQP
jgi:hypothetical protein